MTLSFILCSRNDDYQGNSRWRLETALNYLAERLEAMGRLPDAEVIVSDWGSAVPLQQVVRLRPAAARLVSFLWVPPAMARERQRDSDFPEVLALNAAARRARGAYIGRIDQDTLVGARALSLLFELADGRRRLEGALAGTPAEEALFFANRRGIPFRFVESLPSLEHVTRFIEAFGSRLMVWQYNYATRHVFWTSYVGIWLAHRRLWDACGGYDERLIYYNWMETDMICRLNALHPIVDFGEMTGQDFYHLEHYHPRAVAAEGRVHAKKNPVIDLAAPPRVLHPNGPDWGLNDAALTLEPALSSAETARAAGALPFGAVLARYAATAAVDRAVVTGRSWASAARRRLQPRRLATTILAGVGALAAARRVRLRYRLATDPEVRRLDREDAERFARFTREAGHAVAVPLLSASAPARTALVVSSRCPTIEAELLVIKALELAGCRTIVLLEDERRALRPFYEQAGVARVRFWSEFLTAKDWSSAAASAVAGCGSVDALMALRNGPVRVGMIAVCTALRRLHVGVLDWRRDDTRSVLTRGLAASLAAVAEAEAILSAVRPDMVLTPPEYTPHAELFEVALAKGIDVIAHDSAHRNDALVFKRYSSTNRDDHLTTLSAGTWAHVRELPWTAARRDALNDEVERTYRERGWYGQAWQADAPSGRTAIKRALGLDSDRPAAFVFPHMLWDAPVMWGTPLFKTYQAWFVETIETACRNTHVDWVIKIHPAHVRKQAEERYGGEPAEVRVLRERIGALPAHVRLLPPDTPINTLSLFDAMDYCLTVRGTVGVEAARWGIPVLTAGPARYSERGFTVDSESREDYLAKVETIQTIPRLTEHERELAERFACGLFLLRPLKLETIVWDPPAPGRSRDMIDRQVRFIAATEREWRQAPDVNALARWFASRDEDFLNPA